MVDETRASDADRERAVRDLTRHCGDGRLTLEELEERIAQAYAATTKLELQHALRELPRTPMAIPPAKPPVRVKEKSKAPALESSELAKKRAGEIALRVHMTVFLSVMGLLVMIYALTDLGGYFWPIWTAMPWGMAIAIHAGVHKAVWRD